MDANGFLAWKAGLCMDRIETVLFDVGNVIASDVWEAVWLTRRTGLADKLHLPRSRVVEVGMQLWKKYSIAKYSESDYWDEAFRLFGRQVKQDLVDAAFSENVIANPYALTAVEALQGMAIRIGVVSNNTSFWYPKQMSLSQTAGYVRRDITFLSYDYGVEKSAFSQDLFHKASVSCDPAKTVVVDDRPENIAVARAKGFRTFGYERGRSASMSEGGWYDPPPFVAFEVDAILACD